MDRMGLQEGEVIQQSMISKSIERGEQKEVQITLVLHVNV